MSRYPGVTRRGAGWSWRAQFSEGGERSTLSGSGYDTAKEAAEARAAAIAEARNRKPGVDRTVTLETWLNRWLAGHVETVRPTTRLQYECRVRMICRTSYSSRRLADFDETDWKHVIAELREQAPSTRTLKTKVDCLSTALTAAVRAGVIKDNPLPGIRISRTEEKFTARPWTADEARAFLEHRRRNGDPLYHVWHLALATGLRRGELHGLQWHDIDLDAGVLQVRRQRVDVSGTIHEGAPKTSSSEAPVHLDEGTVAVLEGVHRTSVYVVTDPRTGAPYDCMSTFSADWRRALVSSGAPKIRFHDLRHTSASLLAAAGVPLVLAQARLRHWSPAMTAHYTHADTTMGAEAAGRLGKLLG